MNSIVPEAHTGRTGHDNGVFWILGYWDTGILGYWDTPFCNRNPIITGSQIEGSGYSAADKPDDISKIRLIAIDRKWTVIC